MNIVLLEPEIPQNTGNIGRTCVATDTVLHIIEPIGFFIDDKAIKKSGLDYWQDLDVRVYESFEHFCVLCKDAKVYMATTKAGKIYSDVKFAPDDFIMFGKESKGIPEELLMQHRENAIRIPMMDKYRSLNLASSVAIILYEALRQQDFCRMKLTGQLHNNVW